VVRWLLSLQTDFIDPDTAPPLEMSIRPAPGKSSKEIEADGQSSNAPPSASDLHQSPDKSTMWSPRDFDNSLDGALISSSMPKSSPSTSSPSGMCGRPCKPADTCYAFWAGASLQLLGQGRANALHDPAALRSYLLTLTQHPVMGGFSKFPGDKWADLYHSYLGLAALSLASTKEEREEDGVKELDPGMCVSVEVRGRLEAIWAGI
jgi:geranylgeranyl transferase type-1 subunit beta